MAEPTEADQAWLDRESGYIGFNKPDVHVVVETHDPYAWRRQTAANKLGVDEKELADEPDELRIDQQGYDPIK